MKSLGKRKRSASTHNYSDQVKTKIGRYAAENGNSHTVAKYSKKLGWSVPESTVRNFKRAYLNQLKVCDDPDKVQLKGKVRGRPLLLGELDTLVQSYIKQLRLSGGVVSASIVVAAATGIIKHHNQSLLKDHGGSLDIGKSWAASLMSRMHMVKRLPVRSQRILMM